MEEQALEYFAYFSISNYYEYNTTRIIIPSSQQFESVIQSARCNVERQTETDEIKVAKELERYEYFKVELYVYDMDNGAIYYEQWDLPTDSISPGLNYFRFAIDGRGAYSLNISFNLPE